jgi:hypothetical protein
MIKALLIIWSMDPSGAGTASVQDMPSLTACYQFVGRAQFPESVRAACQPESTVSEVSATLIENRCKLDAQGIMYVCKGRK